VESRLIKYNLKQQEIQEKRKIVVLKISGNSSRAGQHSVTKSAILGTSHIIREVLHSET
jgi:hypothetical protein